MIPDSVPVVKTTKSAITSALNDYRYYSTYSTSSYNTPTYLTSNSAIIKSHSSKNSNLFDTNSKAYKPSDSSRSLLKQFKVDDYSSYTRPLVTDRYSSKNSYDSKKKSFQVSPTYTSSSNKYLTNNFRASSLPSTNSYVSKTVDSTILDGNANYKVTDGIDNSYNSLSERRLSTIKSNSSLGSRKYSTDSTNNYNSSSAYSLSNSIRKKDSDAERKDYSTIDSIRKRYSDKQTINDENNVDAKWAGLRNIGNTCYMNSILQCLGSTKLLKEFVMNKTYVKDINQDGKLINAFSNLISKIWSSSQVGAVDVSSFKEIFQRLAPQFAGYEQHDAQEFLRYLIDKLHADVNRVHTKPKHYPEISDKLSDNCLAAEHWKRYLLSENSFILDLFAGQLKSTLQCLVCGNKSVTFEIFWDVSLPLPAYKSYNSNVSLIEILNNFTQEEILDNREKPKCSKCKVEQRMAKSYWFQKLPKYLVLHLKRFQTTSSYRKLSTEVQFPLTNLDMSPFLAKSVITAPKTYNLYAVSNHIGTPFTGHYTAACKHPCTGDWYNCNDATVTRTSSPIAPKLVNADAYILFYEAVD